MHISHIRFYTHKDTLYQTVVNKLWGPFCKYLRENSYAIKVLYCRYCHFSSMFETVAICIAVISRQQPLIFPKLSWDPGDPSIESQEPLSRMLATGWMYCFRQFYMKYQKHMLHACNCRYTWCAWLNWYFHVDITCECWFHTLILAW